MPLYILVKAMTFAVVMLFATTAAGSTIVVDWNNAALAEVRASRLGPPMVARALAIAHTCMYDAWAQYNAQALATTGVTLRRPRDERTKSNKAQAISFAAYRCLVNLFVHAALSPATGAAAAARLAA